MPTEAVDREEKSSDRTRRRLTEITVRNAKPTDKPYKLWDEDGLHLMVTPAGAKLWRLKFRLEGRERLMGIGKRYPDTTLADARVERDAKRKLIAKGIDPVKAKREERDEKREVQRAIFSDVAERYFRANKVDWSETHRRDVRRIIDKELVPALGKRPIAEIKRADILGVINAIIAREAYTFAKDVAMYFRAILRFYNDDAPEHRAVRDPLPNLKKKIKAPEKKSHAHLEPQETGAFLRKLAHSDATPLVRIAIRLLLLTAVRTTELRAARWSEVDAKAKLWRLPVGRMKARREHTVPLSSQALALLADLRAISGENALIFPSFTDPEQPISENTILFAIYRLGYRGKLTGHGMRSMFSTWAHETGYLSDAVELQLAHGPSDPVKAAYLKSKFLPERTKMMQAWADYLDTAERDNVVPLHVVAA